MHSILQPEARLNWAADRLLECPPVFSFRDEAQYWLDLGLRLIAHAHGETRLSALWHAGQSAVFLGDAQLAQDVLTNLAQEDVPHDWRSRQFLATAWCALVRGAAPPPPDGQTDGVCDAIAKLQSLESEPSSESLARVLSRVRQASPSWGVVASDVVRRLIEQRFLACNPMRAEFNGLCEHLSQRSGSAGFRRARRERLQAVLLEWPSPHPESRSPAAGIVESRLELDSEALLAMEQLLRALCRPVSASDPRRVRDQLQVLQRRAAEFGPGEADELAGVIQVLSFAAGRALFQETWPGSDREDFRLPPWAEWMQARMRWSAGHPAPQGPLTAVAAAAVLVWRESLPDLGDENGWKQATGIAFHEAQPAADAPEGRRPSRLDARPILEGLGPAAREWVLCEARLAARLREARTQLRAGQAPLAARTLRDELHGLSLQPALIAWLWQPVLSYWLGCCLASTEPSDADRVWSSLSGPLSAATASQRALLAIGRGDLTGAATLLTKSPSGAPATVYATGLWMARQGQFWEALEALEELEADTAADGHWRAAARRLRAALCERGGRVRDAERQYRAVLSERPDDVATAARLARRLFRDALNGDSPSMERVSEPSALLERSRAAPSSRRLSALLQVLRGQPSPEPPGMSPLARAFALTWRSLDALEAGQAGPCLEALDEARRSCRLPPSPCISTVPPGAPHAAVD